MIFKRTAKLNGLWLLLVCFVYISPVTRVFATHIMAGEITAKSDTTSATPNLLRYHFKLVTYVRGGQGIEDPTATLFFGDGTSQTSPKASEVTVLANPLVYRRVYYFNHVYAAGGRNYTVTYAEQNRNASIVNMKDPAGTNFLLQTTISINPQLGINRSPQFTVPPLDQAAQGQIFIHLPGAYDLDQDSLSYVLRVPLRNTTAGTTQEPTAAPVFEYKYPNDPKFGGLTVADGSTPAGQAPVFRLDAKTGEIRWNTPGQVGDYNIAFVVEEWKIIPNRKAIKIGEVMRDMQISVKPATINMPPALILPRDTCIVAGSTLIDTVYAIDTDIFPNPKDPLGPGIVPMPNPLPDPFPIKAYGGVFSLTPPAQFITQRASSPQDTTFGVFTWKPTCNDVSDKPYEVVFKVADIPEAPQPSLSALKAWNITVVAPAPKNLVATTLSNRRISLTWTNYALPGGCSNAAKIKIYRKENLANFIPEACETGVPAFTGYTLIGEVAANTNTFIDDEKGAGLKLGAIFCYMIYAEFPLPKGGKSLASNEACAEVPILTSVMTNVSVLETSATTGRIFVRWTQPVGDIANFTGPYQYRLLRAASLPEDTTTGLFKLIYTTPNVTADTSFTDINRNTRDSVYTYKVEFYYTTPIPGGPSQLTLLENGPTASSVRLGALSNGPTMQLTWSYNVPWDNSLRKHLIYRKINNVFTLIDSVQAGPAEGTYTDLGTFGNQPLIVGKVYCYYVETVGFFTYSKLRFGVRNNSQEFCQIVRDTTSPCPPLLILTKLNCDSLENAPYNPPANKLALSNKLNWVTGSGPACGKDLQSFNVYFRPTDTGAFTKIANTLDSAYVHSNLSTTAGCYAVTAVDSSGNESRYSNVVCQDICYFFDLPNIFTPNNDNINDLFVPRQASFVRSVNFRVYNRWGQQVYESADNPNINWPGTTKQGSKVADGVYYYHATVEFVGVNAQSIRKEYKGWVQIVR